ncbi:hypothetical protein L1049_009580 [Liquidambar formosana]|uniref:S-protein homolog n=1 Tax=Liquidambar formosana TaxID=63359 RepID=A0AAP0N607_LIQFO
MTYISLSYASTTYIKRRDLWAELISMQSQFSGPWMAIEDFNAVSGAHEKRGCALPKRSSCDEFQAMTDACGFIHLHSKGAQFTWARGLNSSLEMRLDRGMCNPSWLDNWPNSHCLALPTSCSDYNPLLFIAEMISSSGPKPLRFINAWTTHANFKYVVQDCWNSCNPIGYPMFVIRARLKALKICLKEWNKNFFEDVDDRAKAAVSSLSEIQNYIDTMGATDDLLIKEMESKSELFEALRIQEIFWSEKSRLRWVADGDRNSYFFHNVAKIRSTRQKIHSMRKGDVILQDPHDVQQHIIDYFQSLYTSSNEVIDNGIAESIIPSLVRDGENSYFNYQEVLSKGISKFVLDKKLIPISSPRGIVAPTHSLYADDILVFCKECQLFPGGFSGIDFLPIYRFEKRKKVTNMILFNKHVVLMFLFLVAQCSAKTHVKIKNQLRSGADLTVHCQSKDDDLGVQVLKIYHNFEFSFGTNILGGTRFYCRMQWQNESHYFDIYDQKRDSRACTEYCWWIVHEEGPCFLNPDGDYYDICFPWNKP